MFRKGFSLEKGSPRHLSRVSVGPNELKACLQCQKGAGTHVITLPGIKQEFSSEVPLTWKSLDRLFLQKCLSCFLLGMYDHLPTWKLPRVT